MNFISFPILYKNVLAPTIAKFFYGKYIERIMLPAHCS